MNIKIIKFYFCKSIKNLNKICFRKSLKPTLAYSWSSDENIHDLFPSDINEDENINVKQFSSMELSGPKSATKKRESRPVLTLVMDILGTLHAATQHEKKRAQIKENMYTS